MKHNEQLAVSKAYTPQIQKIVVEALDRCVPLQHFALSKPILTPRVCRYGEGMGYGDRFDSPIIQLTPNDALRTDLSLTIFLTEPESYDGGELCFEAPPGAMKVKLAAGAAIVYSTTVRHRVEPATRGARLVVISWIQSVIKDPAHREIMSDLYKVQDLVRDASPASEANNLLLKIKTAVFKTWADVRAQQLDACQFERPLCLSKNLELTGQCGSEDDSIPIEAPVRRSVRAGRGQLNSSANPCAL